MAKKKEASEKSNNNPNVVGLHAEVLEQPITETMEINFMPYAMSVIMSPRHPGDRRFQAIPQEAPVHHV